MVKSAISCGVCGRMCTFGEDTGRETVAVGFSLDGRYAGPKLRAGEAARSGSSSLPRELGDVGEAKAVPAATPDALEREARRAGEEVMAAVAERARLLARRGQPTWAGRVTSGVAGRGGGARAVGKEERTLCRAREFSWERVEL